MVIPFLTVYLISKGFSLTQAGYAMTAFGCGAMVGGFLGGHGTNNYLRVCIECCWRGFSSR
jgi:predicted MFS family arabinose efflux permease